MPDTNVSASAMISTFYRNNPVKARILGGLLVFILLLLVARISLSPALVYATQSWLKQQGLDTRIEDISIDITGGALALHNATGSSEGRPLFNIGLVEINWHWAPLSEKTIEVSRITLNDLDVKIRHYRDEISIGGVHLPLSSSEKVSQAEAKVAEELSEPMTRSWAAALGEVSFRNLNVCYLQHSTSRTQSSPATLLMDYCVSIDEMTWQGSISYARNRALLENNELPVASSGSFHLNGLKVNDNKLGRYVLASGANTLEDVVVTGLNDIRIKQIHMQQLSALQREDDRHRDAVRFDRLRINDIRLADLARLQIASVDIGKPGLYLVRHTAQDWEYQQWVPRTTGSIKKASESTDNSGNDNNSDASFAVSIGDISISAADWCYLDNSSTLYYCLTYDTLRWQGKLDYSTATPSAGSVDLKGAGEFTLQNTLVHNHSLDRTLLKLASLQLQGMAPDGIDRAVLKQVSLDGLDALQRGNKEDDYTVDFDRLKISGIDYRKNGVKINRINLTGLKALVSKNSDGRFEYEKWLPATDGNKTTDKAAQQQAETARAQKKKPGKPFAISLKQLNINTSRKIVFIDNSTRPPMHLGLQQLRFDLKQLTSNQPESNALFELFAKTTRHGTIELAGSIKPFAEKISFDAKGKLKGLDLRAATPATKKAIGHIIQSGQMDADLKLLAVDGILDSNISLSLYQFHIKALNKKDAEELDRKFGMPLNRTLVLLRNKDGSIHLDIPITGDVNNPDFDPMNAIVKATSKAATVTLITFYTPYGLAYAGGNILFDLATALNFEPITFAAGSSELTDDNTAQLDRLADLLTEKPGIHLTLCGATSRRDSEALFPERGPDKPDVPAPALSAEQLGQLEQLARQRQVNSKDYLVKKKSIDHDRLILCAPEHNTDKEAVSGVEIII